MVKEFTVNCNFKNSTAPVVFYIGNPSDENPPIYFQSKWLHEKKGGTVPKEILDSFADLQKVAIKNHVLFEDLCSFVLEELESTKASIAEHSRVNKNLAIIAKREAAAQAPITTKNPTKNEE